MKEYIFLTFFCILIQHTNAQVEKGRTIEPNPRQVPIERATQDWYSYGNQMINLGGDYSYFRNNIFPDSTVQVEFSSGLGYVWKHSLGQVFDPSSPFFSVSGPGLISDQTNYRLDSLGIWYRYFRHNDSIPDTLIVQIYDSLGVRLVEDPGWSSGVSYASVEYDYTIKKGVNAALEITYLLTNNDTSGFDDQRFLTLPVGLEVKNGNKIAATITYLPGFEFSVGDTIDPYFEPAPTHQKNAFILYEVLDEVPNVDFSYYNHELRVPSSVRYNINSNGWNGDYIPGTAYASGSGIYHLDIEFHITTCDVFDANISSNDADCGTNNGSATISGIGTNVPFTYLWDSGDTLTTNDSLSAGIHNVTVYDSFNCSQEFQVIVNNDFDVSITSNDALCFGENSGSATAFPISGTSPYSYLWGNSQNSSTVSNFSKGEYLITTTDATGCINIQSFTISEPSDLSVTFENVTPAVSGPNGSATAIGSGGTAPYTYNWDNGELTSLANSLSSGIVFVTVTDANGCTTSKFIDVPNNLEDHVLDNFFSLYPNPASGMLNIEMNGNFTSSYLTISNNIGQVVHRQTINKRKTGIDLMDLNKGVYIIHLKSNGVTIQKKLVLN